MNRWKSCSLGFTVAVVVILAALWGPEWIAARRDERLLNSITTEAVEGAEGYRYRMSSNQKLYLLGRCLSSQTLPESELRFLTRVDSETGSYGEMTGTYAFPRAARFRNVVAEHADGGYAHPHADVDGFLGGGDVLFQLFLAVELAARAKAHDFKVVLL